MKVSSDYDSTASKKYIRKYLKSLVEQGIEVHIVTSRFEDVSNYNFPCSHDELFRHAEWIGILKENIHFTNFEDKSKFFLKNPDFIWHIDDDEKEIAAMKLDKTNTIPILVDWGEWQKECNKLINEQSSNNLQTN